MIQAALGSAYPKGGHTHMKHPKPPVSAIFSAHTEDAFEQLALEVFAWQHQNNPVYGSFCRALGRTPETVKTIKDIPFLPVEMFKHHKVVSHPDPLPPNTLIFGSSGTTGSERSRHYVTNAGLYEKSFTLGFTQFYGQAGDYCILALLPGYLERNDSSLVYMANSLIKQSRHHDSGFYLDDLALLAEKLIKLEKQGQKTLLLGVSFALLDFADSHSMPLSHTLVMETGGMKGRRKELVREELHAILKEAFGLPHIHAEYGMTELLSQAWSAGNGLFSCPPWMRILIRSDQDPLQITDGRKTGGINIIDLANINSCSFIATQDLGRFHAHNSFEVLGRFDHSDLRGCSMLVVGS